MDTINYLSYLPQDINKVISTYYQKQPAQFEWSISWKRLTSGNHGYMTPTIWKLTVEIWFDVGVYVSFPTYGLFTGREPLSDQFVFEPAFDKSNEIQIENIEIVIGDINYDDEDVLVIPNDHPQFQSLKADLLDALKEMQQSIWDTHPEYKKLALEEESFRTS